MLHDPTDETHRKPRRLRNTPLKKYVRLTSLVITLCYAGAWYICWRKKVVPLLNDETNQLSEDEKIMFKDYITTPFLRDTIDRFDKLTERLKETKSQDTQTNKAKEV